MESGYHEIDGHNLYYEKIGAGDHPVIFHTGCFGTRELEFQSQYDNFDRNKFTIVFWDRPGYGKSLPHGKNYFRPTIYEEEADLGTKLMEKLGFDRFSIVSFSEGTRIAIHMCLKYPEKIMKLAATTPFLFYDPVRDRAFRMTKNFDIWDKAVLREYEKIYGARFKMLWSDFAEKGCDIVKNQNIVYSKNTLGKISCPVLVIHGENDPFISEKNSRYLQENVQNGDIHIFRKSGHNVAKECSMEFNKVVQSFLLQA